MQTKWNYTELAKPYLKRPDYSAEAIDGFLEAANLDKNERICDVGAGVAHLTLMLLERGYPVTAVEPNDAMRNLGKMRTASYPTSQWHEGTGEKTGQKEGAFGAVTFGSSFNVCDRQKALEESARLLKEGGWFACMWNHRDINDPIQAQIEGIIKKQVEGYNYGTRREEQREVIAKSQLFHDCVKLEGHIEHRMNITDAVEAWRSHATLERQAKDKFYPIIDEIESYLKSLKQEQIQIPYTTHLWFAQKR